MNIVNRKAFHDYNIEEKLEAGLKLNGSEVKSVKGGRIIINDSFVKIVGSEAYLVNSTIPLYPYARPENYDPTRSRKLLLHKKQIMYLKSKVDQSSLTIVPLRCYTMHGLVKLEIGIGRGKKKYEKREQLRRKAVERDIEQAVRAKL